MERAQNPFKMVGYNIGSEAIRRLEESITHHVYEEMKAEIAKEYGIDYQPSFPKRSREVAQGMKELQRKGVFKRIKASDDYRQRIDEAMEEAFSGFDLGFSKEEYTE